MTNNSAPPPERGDTVLWMALVFVLGIYALIVTIALKL